MKLTTLILTLSAGVASAQLFHSDEEFYRFLENRQHMATVQFQQLLRAKEAKELEKNLERNRELHRRADILEDEVWINHLESKLDKAWTQEERDRIIAELNAMREPEVRRALPAQPQFECGM